MANSCVQASSKESATLALSRGPRGNETELEPKQSMRRAEDMRRNYLNQGCSSPKCLLLRGCTIPELVLLRLFSQNMEHLAASVNELASWSCSEV